MKIKLSGANEGVEATFNPSIHIELTDGIYRKDDHENVVRINGRFYRKNSPLVAKLDESIYGSAYFLKSDSVETYEGKWILRGDSFTASIPVERGGDLKFEDGLVYYRSSMYTVYPEGVTGRSINIPASATKGALFSQRYTYVPYQGAYFSSDLVVKLSNRYPPSSRIYLSSSNGDVVTYNGENFLKRDCLFSKDPNGNDYRLICIPVFDIKIDERKIPFVTIRSFSRLIERFHSESKPTPREMLNLVMDDQGQSIELDSDFSVETKVCDFGFTVIKEELEDINSVYKYIIDSSLNKKGLAKLSLVRNWFEDNSIEVNPEVYMSFLDRETGGDYVYSRSESAPIAVSKDLSLTGGIGYTYGLELETSFGRLPIVVAKDINIDVVGDRSIGALEYVTRPLHGSNGINYIDKVTSLLQKYCKIDDRCGVHVHVGGSNKTDTPNFGREFSILSIMLGTQIEKEMFSLLPSDRMSRVNSHGIPYCGSIMAFKDTNMSNGIRNLSLYVFGHEEGFQPGGPDENHELNRWVSSRYKWLNLVNCNTSNASRRGNGGFKTIEFRQYNGTLNSDDIKAYILLSLSFVAFVDRHPDQIIKGGVTINMMTSVLSGEAKEFIDRWTIERRERVESTINILKELKTSQTI